MYDGAKDYIYRFNVSLEFHTTSLYTDFSIYFFTVVFMFLIFSLFNNSEETQITSGLRCILQISRRM